METLLISREGKGYRSMSKQAGKGRDVDR
ncbi:hypothetical protein CCACVL1_31000 [Corchorus capsularis]|uniref:Uncharacterized protein n=1 Tax=Corchorus capsularis TaxID=210143 RepID=A0A1R3FUB0_COCAP|nr:hypothetical protein CCACVL1_31000 [Corchorus capsularis]